MRRGTYLLGTFVAVVALGASPAWAQDSRRPTSSGESSGGSAVSRDPGGSSSAPSSAGSAPHSVGSSDTGRSAPSAPSTSAGTRARAEHFVAPSHPAEREQSRRGGGDSRRPTGGSSSSGARAVPRGGSDRAPSDGSSRGASASAGSDEVPSRRAVPAYSRPREGRPATGTAVDRGSVVGGGGRPVTYYPYYGFGSSYYRSPYRLYYVPGGYGFGLGYFYDPFWYDPYAYDPFGYGGYGYGGYGQGGGYYGGSGQGSYAKAETGSVRLKIKPREAQVYVDGYFVGEVDDFDGLFQKLSIDAGGHRLEIKADGFEPIELDVLVSPGETVTYKGDLKQK